jgi:hypothetical protein
MNDEDDDEIVDANRQSFYYEDTVTPEQKISED